MYQSIKFLLTVINEVEPNQTTAFSDSTISPHDSQQLSQLQNKKRTRVFLHSQIGLDHCNLTEVKLNLMG